MSSNSRLSTDQKRHQSQREMENFCEAFGLTNIEAPSIKAKIIQKKTSTQIIQKKTIFISYFLQLSVLVL